MLHAVIMAGGAGTRFWPASRTALPKQLLRLGGERTLIQATLDRLGDLVPAERTLVVTNQQLVSLVREQLPQLPAAAVVGEPCKRDTAPCVALAAALALRTDPAAVQVVMPADHVIQTDRDFQRAIQHAVNLVAAGPQRIVTFGIRPSYPATTFGYIQLDRQRPIAAAQQESGDSEGSLKTYAVEKFREKPAVELAQDFVESGEFLWNSGIFVWRADTVLRAIGKYAPEIMEPIQRIAAAADRDFENVLQAEFPRIEGRSIDYAVMEHYPEVVVVEAPFGWDDVGTWNSLSRLIPADEAGHNVVGRHVSIDSSQCVIQATPGHLVVTVGVSQLIVVQTPDATLVASRGSEEQLRQVVPALQDRGWLEYL